LVGELVSGFRAKIGGLRKLHPPSGTAASKDAGRESKARPRKETFHQWRNDAETLSLLMGRVRKSARGVKEIVGANELRLRCGYLD